MSHANTRYTASAHFNDDSLAEAFTEYAEGFDSESQAVIYAIRQQLQREVANE